MPAFFFFFLFPPFKKTPLLCVWSTIQETRFFVENGRKLVFATKRKAMRGREKSKWKQRKKNKDQTQKPKFLDFTSSNIKIIQNQRFVQSILYWNSCQCKGWRNRTYQENQNIQNSIHSTRKCHSSDVCISVLKTKRPLLE